MHIECSMKFIADSSRNLIITAGSVNVNTRGNMIVVNIIIIRDKKKFKVGSH